MRRALCGVALILTVATAGAAEERPEATREERREEIRREEVQRPEQALKLPIGSKWILFGGSLKLQGEASKGLDGTPEMDDDIRTFTASTDLEALIDLSPNLRMQFEYKLRGDKLLLDDTRGEDDEFNARLGETWIHWRNLADGQLGFMFGRQKFRDRRRWLYDRDLDAVRMFVDREPFSLELGVSHQLLKPTPREKDVTRWSAYASWEPINRIFFDAYIYKAVDTSEVRELDDYDDSSPLWIGLRSHGRAWDKRIKYWADVAWLGGESVRVRHRDEESIPTVTRFDAWGFDVGATFIWRDGFLPVRTYYTLGYAWGSGDPDPTDGRNREFRQTGVHRNKSRFGGVGSFRYYGILTDPELRNMQIATFGFGLRPTRDSSIDLVYHRYWQSVPFRRVSGWDFDRDPNGVDSGIGDEVDLILVWKPTPRWEVEFNLGLFLPGSAFEPADLENALIGGGELKLNF